MQLFIIGINHNTSPIEIREKLSFGSYEIIEANYLLKNNTQLQEGLILSTCNRVEVYAVGSGKTQDYVNKVKEFLCKSRNVNCADFENKFYTYNNEEAIKHLFKVASGLDSIVIGEVEILGQVKKAYQDGRRSKTTGKILNRLFEKTLNTAKKVRTETFIARGSLSTGSVAVKLAKKILGCLEDKKVLIIGAGKISEQSLLYLKKNGIRSIFVVNRTYDKAKDLAAKFDAEPLKFENFREALIKVDIVITSTGAPHNIIKKDDVAVIMTKRKQAPLFIIDLALPRDVEEEVNKIDNVYLYNIDDLKTIIDKNLNLRKGELDDCHNIISNACQKFMEWLNFESL